MKTLHHWFGVIFAAFFFVISVSGSWLVIDKYVFVPSLSVEQEQLDDVRASEQDGTFISNILPSYPVEHISQIGFPIEEQPFYHIELMDGRADYFHHQSLTKLEKPMSGPVTNFMSRIHKNLLNPWEAGHEIVIWTGLVAIFLTVTGLIIFIPSRRSFRKNRILLPKELSFKDVRRTHLSSGLVFSVFIAFFGATGWMIGEPEAAREMLSSSSEDSIEYSDTLAVTVKARTLPEILEDMLLLLADQRLTRIDFSKQDQDRALYLYTKKADDFALYGHQRIKIDLVDSTVLQLSSGDDKSFKSKALNNAHSLHTCLLYTSPSPRDRQKSRMPSSA